jgi:hypothetical protein
VLDMKEEFNKNIENPKKSNWKSGNEKLNKSSKKLSWKLASRTEQGWDRLSELEGKVEQLEHSDKGKENP